VLLDHGEGSKLGVGLRISSDEFLDDCVGLLEISEGGGPLVLRQIERGIKKERVGEVVLGELIVGVGVGKVASDVEGSTVVLAGTGSITEVVIEGAAESAAQVAVSNHQATAGQDVGWIEAYNAFAEGDGLAIAIGSVLQLRANVEDFGLLTVRSGE